MPGAVGAGDCNSRWCNSNLTLRSACARPGNIANRVVYSFGFGLDLSFVFARGFMELYSVAKVTCLIGVQPLWPVTLGVSL